MPETLEQLIKDAPRSLFPPAGRQRARELARQLDGVGYAEGDQCYLDGQAVRRTLGETLSPAAIDQVLSYARNDDKLRVIEGGSPRPPGRRVSFPELARLVGPGGEPIGDLGLTQASSLEDVRRGIRKKLPRLPADVFDQDLMSRLRGHFEPAAVGQPSAPGDAGTGGAAAGEPLTARYYSWYDCMLTNGVSGAALTLMGVVFGVGVLVDLASGGTLTPGLVWLFVLCFGGGVVAILSAINTCMYWYKYP